MLKIYIYGYLNRIQSSRRLEREAQRNVELMWLTGRLAPDFKTIADFRRDNGAGIRNVCRRFVALCRDLKLFSQAIVAIDSSKFKAVNSRDRNFTPGKIDKRQEQIEQSVQRYLDALETADRTQPVEIEARTERLQEKIRKLRQQMHQLDGIKERLKSEPGEQLSLTDPDARSMISQAKGTGVVGYNVQAAVDAKHHLIVAHEVTNIGSDRSQLAKMAVAAREAMGTHKLKALADRGYFNGPEIKACDEAGIKPLVPKPMTSNAKAEGRFSKADFIYIARDDVYRCPAGQPLRRHQTTVEGGLRVQTYWTYICPHCPLKAQCTTGNERRVMWRVNLDARGATIWMRTVSRRVDDAAHLIVAGAIHAGVWLSPDLRALQWRSLRAHALAFTSRRLQSADRDPRGPIRARGAIYAGG